MSSANPNLHGEPEKTETLQERSARLEAEAARIAAGHPPEHSPEQGAGPEQGSDTAQIETLRADLATAREQTLRALAEAENARKRAAREREDAGKFAISSFARDLLAVADNLRRAIESIPQDIAAADERIRGLADGIGATERELLKSFEKNGIRKIEPLGQMFDPNLHEVMFEAPGTGQPGGTVIQVIEAGYVLNDRLLRPARVGVAKADDSLAGGHIDTQA